VLAGEKAPADELVKEFEARAKELDDEDYKKVEVSACDVKDIQNTPLGVPGFWMRAMLNHGGISRLIQEKDRPILMHLQDVQCNLHTEGYGFELIFVFEKNDYFKNASLRKSFLMTRQNIIEKCEGTEIEWKEGKDVTKKKIKKKQKAKKGQPGKTITKTVEQESFFNFFKTIEMPDEEELAGDKKPEADDEEGEEKKDAGELMDEDYDMGQEFKDQLTPLALEYYLEVIQEDDEDDDDEDDCDDDHCGHKHGAKDSKGKDASDDEDEDDKPAKGGKKKGKGGKGGEAGQQECKQQ
jgi:nucleosome assembly protein 1-like 1